MGCMDSGSGPEWGIGETTEIPTPSRVVRARMALNGRKVTPLNLQMPGYPLTFLFLSHKGARKVEEKERGLQHDRRNVIYDFRFMIYEFHERSWSGFHVGARNGRKREHAEVSSRQ